MLLIYLLYYLGNSVTEDLSNTVHGGTIFFLARAFWIFLHPESRGAEWGTEALQPLTLLQGWEARAYLWQA